MSGSSSAKTRFAPLPGHDEELFPDRTCSLEELSFPQQAGSAFAPSPTISGCRASETAGKRRHLISHRLTASGAKRSLTEALMSVKCDKRPAPKAEVADRSCRSCSNEIGTLRVIS